MGRDGATCAVTRFRPLRNVLFVSRVGAAGDCAFPCRARVKGYLGALVIQAGEGQVSIVGGKPSWPGEDEEANFSRTVILRGAGGVHRAGDAGSEPAPVAPLPKANNARPHSKVLREKRKRHLTLGADHTKNTREGRLSAERVGRLQGRREWIFTLLPKK